MADENKKIRVRLAPSPTGYVHIGTLRTALFDFLLARKAGGSVILRIEDTDQNRFVEGAIENMLKVFESLGLIFDEGYYVDESGAVKEKGDYGPYLQSKRLDLYHKHALILLEKGSAYYCFCSEARLDELRKEQTALKKPPMYDRHCRSLSKEEVAQQLETFRAEGKTPVIRQAVPLEGKTVIHDLIYGDITYENSSLDDQILLKSDGFPTYHLAVVVDDHHMEISHVLRGDEWIPSTPKHILLYQAFGWQPTLFAHLPLILNTDKSKLSKRNNDVSVEDFLKKGYLKEALLNFLAFLGWNPKTEQEIFSMQELVEQFDLSKVNKAGAVFDINKLDWINSLYIRKMPLDALAEVLVPYWIDGAYIYPAGDEFTASSLQKDVTKQYLQTIAGLERERLKKLSEIGERTKYFFAKPEYESTLLVWKKSTPEDAKEKLSGLHALLRDETDFSKENLELVIKKFIESNGGDNGSVLWPLRVAVTGMEKSPGPFEVAAALAMGLGKEEVLTRITVAAEKL